MICRECGGDKPEKDFLQEDVCFRCQYRKKTNTKENMKARKCRQCGIVLCSGRWIYCSNECSKKGEKEMKKNYWTNLL